MANTPKQMTSELLKQKNDLLRAENLLSEEAKKQLTAIREQLNNITDITLRTQKQAEIDRQIVDENQKIIKIQQKMIENQEKNIKRKLEYINLLRQENKITAEQAKRAREAIKDQLNRLEEEKKSLKNSQAEINQWKLKEKYLDSVNRKLTLREKLEKNSIVNSTGLLGNMQNISNIAKSLNSFEGMFFSLLALQIDSTIKSLAQLDTALVAIKKATGMTSGYDSILKETYLDQIQYGITVEDQQKAYEALHKANTKFVDRHQAIQKDIQLTASLMDKFGVTLETSSRLFSTFTNNLKMTPAKAKQTQIALLGVTQALKLSPDVINQIPQVLSQMAVFGDKMPNELNKLLGAAEATNIALTDLVSIAKQFDTFDAAAQSAAQLNTILGGQSINASELVGASYTKRISIIKKSFEESGRHWNSMDNATRIAVAHAAGISDLDTAQRLFTTSTVELERQEREAQKTAENKRLTEEKLKEGIKDLTTVTEKLNILFRQMAIAAVPLLLAFRWILEKIIDLNEYTHGIFIPGLTALLGIYLLMKTRVGDLVKWFGRKLGMIKALTVAEKEKAVADKVLTETTTAQGKAAEGAWKSTLALGFAIALIGGGIYLATTGIANLAEATGNMKDNVKSFMLTVGLIMGSFIGMIYALGKAGQSAGPGLAVIGFAILAIGAGIAIATYGISLLIDSFSNLKTGGSEILKVLGGIVLSMTLLSAISVVLAATGIAAAIGIVAIALSLGAMGLALAFIKTKDLEYLSVTFDSLSKIKFDGISFDKLITGLTSVKDQLESNAPTIFATATLMSYLTTSINEVVEAINKLSSVKAISLSASLDSLSGLSENIKANITPDTISHTTKLIEQVERFSTIVKEDKALGTKDTQFVTFLKELKELLGNKASNTTDVASNNQNNIDKKPIIIKVNIDGREVGKTAEIYLNDKYKLFAT